jgi:polyisoprenoid-binding protein YceI
MKLYFIKLTLVLLPFLFIADSTTWKVKTSAITFKIKNAGLIVNGSFTGLEADIKFNPLKPEEGSIKASVNTKSINTGIDMRNSHLSKPEYFDVEKYPKIKLESTKIEKTGPISFSGTFKLTIKNVTKEITIPFNFLKLPEKTEFNTNFSINRRDYGVGGSSLTMADDVNISIVVDVTE